MSQTLKTEECGPSGGGTRQCARVTNVSYGSIHRRRQHETSQGRSGKCAAVGFLKIDRFACGRYGNAFADVLACDVTQPAGVGGINPVIL